jgi:hypothetical protein
VPLPRDLRVPLDGLGSTRRIEFATAHTARGLDGMRVRSADAQTWPAVGTVIGVPGWLVALVAAGPERATQKVSLAV